MVIHQIVLDDWQREILNYDGNILLCTGRQVGKTLIFSRKAAKYLLEHPGSQIIVVSLTEDQAKLMIIMIQDYLQKNHPRKVRTNQRFTNQNKITLINNSRVIARPVGTTGDAVRGFTGDVLIIDEASGMPEIIFSAAKPTLLTTGGQIWICSTPRGKTGYFYECWLNRNDRFKVFHLSSEEVIKNRPIKAGWTEERRMQSLRHLEDEKKDMSEIRYAQEYLGIFQDDIKRFYSDEWIERVCCIKKESTGSPKTDNYMGVDIARMGGDMTTYEILHNKDAKVTKQIAHFQENFKPTTHTEQRIIALAEQFKVSKVGIDAGSGSLGVGVYDHLFDPNSPIRHKVVAMNNRSLAQDSDGAKIRIMNEDYHDNLRAMGEHREILLFNDDQIKNSFRSILIETPKEENRLTKVRIWGRDSHIVEGIKRAAWLAKKEKSKNFFISYM